jgi:hypothetical protein
MTAPSRPGGDEMQVVPADRTRLGRDLADLALVDPAVRHEHLRWQSGEVHARLKRGERTHPLPCRDQTCVWHHETQEGNP